MNNVSCGLPIYDFPVPASNRGKKQTYAMTPLGIVTHNTYNNASAKAEASYMVGNGNWTSFHSAVDEKAVYECIPFHRNSWHCGATYGNRHYIGVEIARSTADLATFKKAEDNAARYIAGILVKYKWGIDKVYTHQQQSGKYCPHKTLDLGWNRFLSMVEKYRVQFVSGKITRSAGGFSVKVIVPSNDTLTVREGPGTEYRKVSSYRPNSIIWVEEQAKNTSGETWYKIPGIGYVHSGFCQKIAKPSASQSSSANTPKKDVVVYKNDGNKVSAECLAYLLGIECYKDNPPAGGNYNILDVSNQGKNRRETAKIVFNKYL